MFVKRKKALQRVIKKERDLVLNLMPMVKRSQLKVILIQAMDSFK